MNKLNRQKKDNLQRYANRLPNPLWVEIENVVTMTGKEAKDFSIDKEICKQLDDYATYQFNIPKFELLDHYKELCKAYTESGDVAVDIYAIKVLLFAGILDPKETDVIQMVKDANGGVVDAKIRRDALTGVLVKANVQRQLLMVVCEDGVLRERTSNIVRM